MRHLAFAIETAAVLLFTHAWLWAQAPAQQAQFGSEKEARAMLEKAVAAVKADKTKSLEMFN